MYVTPSAISNSLARLRTALGDPLVIRSGRGIVPTPRAAELAPLLKRALGDMERAVQAVAFDAASTTRQFTLAIADAGQLSLIPRLSRLLSSHMPHARLRVVGIDTFLSSGGLAGTEVDVAIAALPDKAPGVHFESLYDEQAVPSRAARVAAPLPPHGRRQASPRLSSPPSRTSTSKSLLAVASAP